MAKATLLITTGRRSCGTIGYVKRAPDFDKKGFAGYGKYWFDPEPCHAERPWYNHILVSPKDMMAVPESEKDADRYLEIACRADAALMNTPAGNRFNVRRTELRNRRDGYLGLRAQLLDSQHQ